MTFPTGPVPIPDVVDELAAGRPVAAVWENELGGVTFAIGAGDEYVKTYPAEHARWAKANASAAASGP